MKLNYLATFCQVQEQSALGWIVGIILGVAVFIGLMYLLRELFCWYWKINQMVSLQNDQVNTLKYLVKKLEAQSELQRSILDVLQKNNGEGIIDNGEKI